MAKTTNENKGPTKEALRDYWSGILQNQTLISMALPSLANQLGYGGESLHDVDRGKYVPAVTSKEGEELIKREVIPYFDFKDVGKNLVGSRYNNEIGSGTYSVNLKEKQISDALASRVGMAFRGVTVDDVFKILGHDGKIPKEYQGKYIEDLIESKDENAQILLSGALSYLVKSQIADATGKSAEAIKQGTLEKILTKEDSPKE